MVGAGKAEGSMDAANLLKPALARGELRCIGATTLDEFREHIEKDPALERRFQPVFVGEPSVDDTIAILRGLKERYEVHHKVKIKDSALVTAAKLASRYITDRFLPDKAIDLVDEAASRLAMELQSVPTEIDVLQRRLLQLQLAERMLQSEEEEHARERLAEVQVGNPRTSRNSSKTFAASGKWKSPGSATSRRFASVSRQSRPSTTGPGTRFATCSSAATDPRKSSSRPWRRSIPSGKPSKNASPKPRPQATGSPRKRSDCSRRKSIPRKSRKSSASGPASRFPGCSQPSAKSCSNWKTRSTCGSSTKTRPCTPWRMPCRRSRAGLQDPNRPIGSFLFLGPTGVGKTELAKALAEFLFDSETAIVRLDMSEYGERHNVARLIGAPPGYVGYEEGGRLTEAVRRRPYSVVLLDEMEKAHRDVFNVLLQVLDDGRLTDGQGRTVDFRNTVIIMTSNLGSHIIAELAGTGDHARMTSEIQNVLRAAFLPEFLNRIDETIVFHPLGMKELTQIVEIQLRRLQGQLSEAGLTLRLTDRARARLADEGFDPAYGARPLKRIIQQRIANPLATALLEQKVNEGRRR